MLQIQLVNLRAQFIFERTFTNDLALKKFSALCKQSARADQIGEPLFCNQTTNANDQRWSRRKIRSSEFGEIEAVVNTVDAIVVLGKSLSQKLCREIGFSYDRAGCVDELIKS